ncbi:MAG: insulinase family protein, partial [Lysobacteraceae bacterium]
MPKDLPPFGAERALPPIRIEQRTFANGLTVWVLPREDGPPKIHYVLAVRGGLAADPSLQSGLSSLLASLLK